MDYRETYASLPDSELLHIADHYGLLEQEAQLAINAELSRRKFNQKDVLHHEEGIATSKLGDFWAKGAQHIARSFNGCGTGIYGKRDFRRDGSFVTTKWFIAFFVPVVPLSSMRVRLSKRSYLEVQRVRLNWSQVGCV